MLSVQIKLLWVSFYNTLHKEKPYGKNLKLSTFLFSNRSGREWVQKRVSLSFGASQDKWRRV
jgi:hypothetical protein